jgi:hypothetical protein
MSRRGGLLQLQINGDVHDAKGNYEINMGKPKKETIVGADRVHGYKSMPQAARITGEITDAPTLSLEEIADLKDATIAVQIGTGKTYTMTNAWNVADGTLNTDEGNIPVDIQGVEMVEA